MITAYFTELFCSPGVEGLELFQNPNGNMEAPPLIVTLALDADADAFFNALRQQHFPREHNFLAAHLTLFHQLPPLHQPQILHDLETLSVQQAPISLAVTAVVSIGRGVAYKMESPVLQNLHKQWQQQWQPWLTPQDRQTLWPHVTVQNKVAPQTAQALHQQLKVAFVPFTAQGIGVQLWQYLKGPWQPVQLFSFGQSSTTHR